MRSSPWPEASAPYPSPPAVPWENCPIATTLGSLGRKWTLTILRDVAFFPDCSFSFLLKRNPGLRQRTLSLRLRQLASEELVRKVSAPDGGRHPRYELTPKGLEVWPILAALFQFGTRHHAATVFADGRPRSLSEVYPRDASLMLGPLAEFARTASPARSPGPATSARGSRPTSGGHGRPRDDGPSRTDRPNLR